MTTPSLGNDAAPQASGAGAANQSNNSEDHTAHAPGQLPTPAAGSAPAGAHVAAPVWPYRETRSGLVLLRKASDGEGIIEHPLCNFTARILTDITVDDGAEVSRHFEIQASMPGSCTRRFLVSADQFAAMSWPLREIGAKAIIYPEHNSTAHARTAIQVLSPDAKRREEYGHTGWREIGGAWYFLHAGGGIGANGPCPEIHTSLTGPLSRYRLPDPPTGDRLLCSLRATFGFLELGPPRLTYPLLASVMRAILGGADFTVFLVGRTGTFKTETAALVARFFGPEMEARNVPGSWSSTENSLEEAAFLTKDAVYVVDDFKPCGDSVADSRLHQKGDRVMRAQGNHSGRQRMRADGSLRPPRPPRCLMLATGEDIPRGESLRARLLILEVAPGDIDPHRLTLRQRDAAAGLYAETVSACCAWAAPRLPDLRMEFKQESATLRDGPGRGHARLRSIAAELTTAFRLLLRFARDVSGGAIITDIEASTHLERCTQALAEAGAMQAEHQRAADPVTRFLELLVAALHSGRAHVAAKEGSEPEHFARWGWRVRDDGGGHREPRGERIGWIDGDDLFLEPSVAHRVAQSMAGQGDGIAVSERTLRKRLHERGLLVTTDSDRGTLTVRKQLQERRVPVLHLQASALEKGTEVERSGDGGEA